MKADRRSQQPRRRALNAQHYGFAAPDGTFSWSKFISTVAQVAVLVRGMQYFDDLIKSWDSLLIILAFIIAPDMLKKLITMRYGGTGGSQK